MSQHISSAGTLGEQWNTELWDKIEQFRLKPQR